MTTTQFIIFQFEFLVMIGIKLFQLWKEGKFK